MAAMADAGAKKKLKTFPGLGADEFQHPHDAAATAALSSVPGLDTIVAKVMELGLERVYYLENTADISYCWHPKLRILVGGTWWCQWWEKIPEDA